MECQPCKKCAEVAIGMNFAAPGVCLLCSTAISVPEDLVESQPVPSSLDSSLPSDAAGRRLRATQSVCNTCLVRVPAAVVAYTDRVMLEKYCPEHGTTDQLLSHAPAYWTDLDRYYFQVNGENYPQRDYIVRMTERCNLDCPICLAKANTEDTPDLDLSGLQALLSERRGIKIDLMAAEPTLRPDLEDWIRRVKASGNIAALHTNGLKLANFEYAKRIKEAGVDEVFVQFDGFDEEANKALRGRPLLKARLAAMANLRRLDLATSLIVVIARGLNEAQVGETYRFALQPENDHIREVFYLGLRLLGSARDSMKREGRPIEEMSMMPDELIDLLCASEPRLKRPDIQAFNKLYFAMLSAFKVKKCLYVQHYLVTRDGAGAFTPIADLVNLAALDPACERYAERHREHPTLARAALAASVVRHSANAETAQMLMDLARLQLLFKRGMNLDRVPRRFLVLGFITACDPYNFDSRVAVNCGKGELSADGGFVDSGAEANVAREARFEESDRRPSALKRGDLVSPDGC